MIQITEKHQHFDKIMSSNGYQMVLCANSPLFVGGVPQGVREDTPAIEWNVVAVPFHADLLDIETIFNAGQIACKGIVGGNIIGTPSRALCNATEYLLYHHIEIEPPYLYSFAEHAFMGKRVQGGLTRTQKRVSYFPYYVNGERNPTLDVLDGNDLANNPTGLVHKSKLSLILGPSIAPFFMALEVIGHRQLIDAVGGA